VQTPSEVNRAPFIEEEFRSTYTVREGKPVKLTCYFTAHPRCEIIWTKDNQQIRDNYNISSDDTSTVLSIKETNLNDAGVYSAILRNSHGQAKTTTQLFIKQ
jgi:hypothetical protein